jgi:Protein of unknown function, DUF481
MHARESQAQIANVQSFLAKPKPGLSVQIDGSFDFRSWNNKQTLLGGSFIARYMNGNSLVLALARGDVVKRRGSAWQERHLEHLRYRYTLEGTPFDLEAFAQHSTDVFRRLDHRFLVGAGPRARILTGPPLELALGLTPMFEYEQLGEGNSADARLTRQRGRLSTYVIIAVNLGERITMRHSVYIQTRFDDVTDTRVLNEFDATVSLNKTFAFRWSLVEMYDPRAPKGIVPLDTTAKSSVVVNL